MGQRLDKAILDGIQGVRFVAQQPMTDPVGQSAVAPEQFFQSVTVAASETCQQLFVARSRRTGCGDNSHDVACSPKRQTVRRACLFGLYPSLARSASKRSAGSRSTRACIATSF